MTSESSDVDGLHICVRMQPQRDVMMGVMVCFTALPTVRVGKVVKGGQLSEADDGLCCGAY